MTMNRRSFHKFASGSLASLGLGLCTPPATAQLVNKYAEQLENGEFNWFPERSAAGPMLIIVSIPDQKLHVYRNGIRVAASTCSTGKPGHSTPTGVFKILEKDKHHRSSTYNNAPMPNMNRLTWSGIALHAGPTAGLSGVARLRSSAAAILRDALRHHQEGPDCRHRRQQVLPVGSRSSRHGAWSVCPQRIHRRRYGDQEEPVQRGPAAKPKSTSVVVSAKDKKISVFEDGKVVATGTVKIKDDTSRCPIAPTCCTASMKSRRISAGHRLARQA